MMIEMGQWTIYLMMEKVQIFDVLFIENPDASVDNC